MKLQDKVVLITGSSSGIGKTTALRFAQEGANIIINYNINKEGAEVVVEEIKKIGREAIAIQADVAKEVDVDRLFQEALGKFSTVDILINNASIATDKAEYRVATQEQILEMINADLIGALMCSQRALNIMEKQGYGKILNTSSIRGCEYGGRSIVYAAAKAGINSFTKTLAKQVAPNIQVNAVGPGFVKTRTYDNMPKERTDAFLNQTYLKRWVTEEEIADAFVFLAKNDAMIGQVIYVDGGFTLK